MWLAYVRRLTSMQHACVHGLSVQKGVYTFQKRFFKKKSQQYFGKICKWKGQCHVCIGKAFLDYNIDPSCHKAYSSRLALKFPQQWKESIMQVSETLMRSRRAPNFASHSSEGLIPSISVPTKL
jgi:hypothetical protein